MSSPIETRRPGPEPVLFIALCEGATGEASTALRIRFDGSIGKKATYNSVVSSMSKLQIEERRVDDVTVVVLSGQMLLDDGDLAFRRHIAGLLDESRIKILVDLDGVSYIDSSGVGMMVAQLKTVRQRGGDMRLMRLNSRGQRMFTLLKLRSTFEAFDDEAMAMRSFVARPSAT